MKRHSNRGAYYATGKNNNNNNKNGGETDGDATQNAGAQLEACLRAFAAAVLRSPPLALREQRLDAPLVALDLLHHNHSAAAADDARVLFHLASRWWLNQAEK